jgi:hypothetical protein
LFVLRIPANQNIRRSLAPAASFWNSLSLCGIVIAHPWCGASSSATRTTSPEHEDRVWEPSEKLLQDSVHCRVEMQEESPAEGWPRWCCNQVREAECVRMVCTATYQRRYEGKEKPDTGLVGQWERVVMTRERYDAEGKNTLWGPDRIGLDPQLFGTLLPHLGWKMFVDRH